MSDNRSVMLEKLGVAAVVKTLAATRVAAVRHVGPYAECKPAWVTLCGWAGPKGLLQHGTQFMGVGYDNPDVTPANEIRYDACISVDGSVEAEKPVSIMDIPAGDYACVEYKGPYTGLKQVYEVLCEEGIPALGREFAMAPCVEVYLNHPDSTPEEELLTEIRMPLK